jgi:DNA-binding IclR family transcriptional regulator
MTDTPRPAYTVGAARSAVRILRYLGGQDEPVRLVRIASELGLNPSTCLNILRTLTDEGLVCQQASGKVYSLGLGLVELAHRALKRGEDLNVIRPMMDRLARKRGVSILLWRRIGDDVLALVACAVSNSVLNIRGDVGVQVPLLTGSMGRVIAASGGLDHATLRECFAKVEWQKAIDFDTYMDQVEQTRVRGWSTDSGYSSSTAWGLSAPISTLGAPTERILSATLLVDQFCEEELEAIAHDLVELASAIGSAQPHLWTGIEKRVTPGIGQISGGNRI